MDKECESCHQQFFAGCYDCCGNGVNLCCDLCNKTPYICDQCYESLNNLICQTPFITFNKICMNCKSNIKVIKTTTFRENNMCDAEPSHYKLEIECNGKTFVEEIHYGYDLEKYEEFFQTKLR